MLTGDASEPILEDTTVLAGEYDWLRLYVLGGSPDSEVELADSTVHELFVPGGQPQSQNNNSRFLHLNSGFVVPAGGNADFTIDFVLRKALTKPASQSYYLLRPAHRLINNVEVGSISGSVDSGLLSHESCPDAAPQINNIYLYPGHDAAVGDVNVDEQGEGDHATDDTDGDAAEINPLTTANVVQNNSGGYEYYIGFVAGGDYTVAFTCQAGDDVPDTDEAIEFPQSHNVSVNANQDTTQNFTVSTTSTSP